MTDNQEDDGNEVLVGTPDSARAIVSWQHNRYHHLQSLAQGLLGSILTALAITTTILTAFNYNFGGLPQNISVYQQAAQEFPIATTPVAAKAVVSSNYLVFILLLLLSGSVLLTALDRLYTVIANPPLEMGITSRNYVSIVSGDNYEKLSNGTGIKSLKSNYTKIIRQNQRQIETTNEIFTQAAMRTLISLFIAIMAVYIHWKVTVAELVPLVLLNVSALLPSTIVSNFLSKMSNVKPRNVDTGKTGIIQELFLEHTQSSRWDQFKENRIEAVLLLFIQIISIPSLLIVSVFYLNSLLA